MLFFYAVLSDNPEALYRWGFLLTGIQETLETRLLGALGNGREVSP